MNKHATGAILSQIALNATEAAAVASAKLRGFGRKNDADQAAVDAMRKSFQDAPFDGRVVIGEGEIDEAPMLYIGEKVGAGGIKVDIAVDPLEGTNLCACDAPNSMTVVALAPEGGLLHAPDMYMDKLAIGPGYPAGLIDLDLSPRENVARLAKAKGVAVSEIRACLLDRPRHKAIVEELRKAGAGIRLIPDGDVAGVFWTTEAFRSGIDIYFGSGGAPEGVLAAAAIRCAGGQMQARLKPESDAEIERAKAMGHADITRKFTLDDMAPGDVVFAASGVTDGSMFSGVHFAPEGAHVETIVWDSFTGRKSRVRSILPTR
ncbi:MAG TPA: class II fructose-bisphosphatase [Terricaulis sp.]|nr:class II fructose-bisphosphatase [Terricaulis sp.]HRP09565.1 class II fructose-bisphosphatase [Terricaulis sp.]